MKRINRRLPSPGIVVGVIALIIALAGTAVALPGKGGVDKNDIRKGAVGLKQVSKSAERKLDTRWALINESGQIERQTGGFSLVNCYQANDNCYINAGTDVRNNGLHAQIALNNSDGTPILSAETGVAPCGATFVNCAPPGTEANNVLVVAPRESDGSDFGGAMTMPPSPTEAARFYVFVTGSESN